MQYNYKGYMVTLVAEGSLFESAPADWHCVVNRSAGVVYNGPRRRSEDETRADAESWIEAQCPPQSGTRPTA